MNHVIKHLSFYVTSVCNGRCKHCATSGVRWHHPKYHMSMDEVHAFIEALERNDIRIRQIGMTGGEPLMWPNLTKAARALKASGRVGRVRILTNGRLLRSFTVRSLAAIDGIRITIVNKATAGIYARQKRRFGKKLSYEQHKRFVVMPPKVVSGEPYPVDCRCDFRTYFNGYVYVCGGVLLEGMRRPPWEYPDWQRNPITNDNPFLFLKGKLAACRTCMANRSIKLATEKWSRV